MATTRTGKRTLARIKAELERERLEKEAEQRAELEALIAADAAEEDISRNDWWEEENDFLLPETYGACEEFTAIDKLKSELADAECMIECTKQYYSEFAYKRDADNIIADFTRKVERLRQLIDAA